jgi:hypothetical protein
MCQATTAEEQNAAGKFSKRHDPDPAPLRAIGTRGPVGTQRRSLWDGQQQRRSRAMPSVLIGGATYFIYDRHPPTAADDD